MALAVRARHHLVMKLCFSTDSAIPPRLSGR